MEGGDVCFGSCGLTSCGCRRRRPPFFVNLLLLDAKTIAVVVAAVVAAVAAAVAVVPLVPFVVFAGAKFVLLFVDVIAVVG